MGKIHAVLDTSGIKRLQKDLKKLEKGSVDFGYPEPDVHEPSGLTYGHLASILEWGIRDKIPPRPALRQTVETFKTDKTGYETAVKASLERFLESKNRIADAVYRASGEHLSDQYADTMDDWRTIGSRATNNAPLTIDLKGFNKPFEETGELIDNVDYRVNT